MILELSEKYAALEGRLRELRSVVVAFSGGVDSAFVALAAVRTLGSQRVLAVTARSPSVPPQELADAARIAGEIAIPHEFVETDEFSNPDYIANPTNRCYFCKTELYSLLAPLARQRGFRAVVNGVNWDDLGDYRPGLKAAAEHGVLAPLAEAGITKRELRAMAAELGLSIHDKPAGPCLSSRVQYGEAITAEKLAAVNAAEQFLRALGFAECRVRHHDRLARIEVPADRIGEIAENAVMRRKIDSKFRSLGYLYVTVDLRGLRSGSMNEVLLGPGFPVVSSEA